MEISNEIQIIVTIISAFLTIFGAGLVAYYKWSFDDLLSREKILKGFKYEIEILTQRIIHIINRENDAWYKPLYDQGGLYYVNNAAIPRFPEALAKNLIVYYANIVLSERMIRQYLNAENQNRIVTLLIESQLLETDIINKINTELQSVENSSRNQRIVIIIGLIFISFGLFSMLVNVMLKYFGIIFI